MMYKLLSNNFKSSLSNDEPLPFTTLFYDSETFEIKFQLNNENTKNVDKKDRYKFHSETLSANKIIDENLLFENLHCLTTYMPCYECFLNLAKVNKNNLKYRVQKVHFLLKEKSQSSLENYHNLRAQGYKLRYGEIEINSDFVKRIKYRCRDYIEFSKVLINNSNN